jgi:tetratricopeptide (TPR) repeat protein
VPVFLFTIPAWAQPEATDSLPEVINVAKGIERITLLIKIAGDHLDENPQVAHKYAKEAIRLAEAASENIFLSDALKIEADALYYLDSIKPATFAYLHALDVEEQLPVPRPQKLTTRLSDVGFCYQDMGLFDKSLSYFQRALDIARQLNDSLEIASNLSNIGVSLKMMGRYGEAIDMFNQVLELDKLRKNETDLATDYNNIGVVYREWSKYDLAVEFFNKAIEIDERLGNRHKLSTRYSNIGQVYLIWEKYPEALGYFNKALEIDRDMNAPGKIALRLQGLGLCYLSLKEYNKAIEYLKQAKETFQTLNLDFQTAIVTTHIGDAYTALNDQKNAQHYYEESLLLAQKHGLDPTVIEAAKGLYNLYKNQGNYQKAIFYFEIFKAAEDSVFSEASARQINEFGIRYETEKKENENHLLSKDVQLLRKDVEIKTRNQWFLGSIIVALALISLALYYAFSLKRKSLIQSRVLFDKESELSKLKIDQAEKRNKHLQEVLFAEEEIKRLQAASIDQKNQQMISATMLIANKNEVFGKLEKLAGDLGDCDKNEKNDIIREIRREIERQTDVEGQWEQFKLHFENVHKSFFTRLRSNGNNLTQTDLQLCAYIKLNMATKEIARLMNIAPESVNTHRYRLRKKLALQPDVTLDDFIHDL